MPVDPIPTQPVFGITSDDDQNPVENEYNVLEVGFTDAGGVVFLHHEDRGAYSPEPVEAVRVNVDTLGTLIVRPRDMHERLTAGRAGD
ncbi:MAG TPA: hypothetical protein VN238_00940 [Solirubrobacteraceae bacterium]|nr:hypothetical protein [Solirubrobacteraceae bacterium]